MVRCGRPPVLVWLCKLHTIEDHVLCHATVVSSTNLLTMFDYTCYFVTVGLSSAVQLRLLVNCSGMLELLESVLCCLVRHFFPLSFVFSVSFPDVIKTCYSISVCQALRNQTYRKIQSTVMVT